MRIPLRVAVRTAFAVLRASRHAGRAERVAESGNTTRAIEELRQALDVLHMNGLHRENPFWLSIQMVCSKAFYERVENSGEALLRAEAHFAVAETLPMVAAVYRPERREEPALRKWITWAWKVTADAAKNTARA